MASVPKPVVTGYPAAAQPSYTAAAQPSYTAAVPGGVAYPYPAPPPPPPPYYNTVQPAYYQTGRRTNAILIRRLLALAIAAFVVIGAVTLVVWLVLRPRLPQISVSSLRLSSFNLSSSSSLLSADFDLSLSVQNPNKKMSISYNRVSAAVLFDEDVLAETSLPPFFQSKRNSTILNARMAAVGEYVNPQVADGISRQRAGGGVVGLDVRVLAVVRFQAGAWRTRTNVMRAYCKNMRVTFANATTIVRSLASPPEGCRVDV